VTRILRSSIDELLLAVILGMSFAATVAVVVDKKATGSREQAGRQFQRLVGGLGLGCQTDLARSAWQFDPRLTADDDAPLDVLLENDVSNPWHAMALFPEPAAWPEAGLRRPASIRPD
jgi:hypothetical protein